MTSGNEIEMPERRFSYRRLPNIIGLCGLVVAYFSFTSYLFFFDSKPGDNAAVEAAILLYAGALFFLLLLVVGIFYWSDWMIRPSKISLIVFRREWKSFDWGSIARIRMRYIPDFGKMTKLREFCFDLRDDRFFSVKARFNESIEGYDELLELLNRYVAQHHIPIESEILGDQGPRTRLSRDPVDENRLIL